MHENRETSGAPRPERERGRSAKAQSQKADAHAPEESDRTILSYAHSCEQMNMCPPSVDALIAGSRAPVQYGETNHSDCFVRTFYIHGFPERVRQEPVNGFILWSQPVHRQTICKQCRRSRDSRKETFPPSPTAAPRRRMGDAIDLDSQGRNPAKAR
jgi:hypothetical protein